jgi:PKD repeat protein
MYYTISYPNDVVMCKFNTPGTYTVTLTVTDDQERTHEDTCLVNVVAVDMVPGTHFVTQQPPPPNIYISCNYDDDDDDGVIDKDQSGTVAGEDNLLEIQLSVAPTDLPGEVYLRVNEDDFGYYTCFKVWSDPDKQNLIIPNGSPLRYYAKWLPSELPAQLYVEGYNATAIRGVWLFLYYVAPEWEPISPWDRCDYTVVELEVFIDSSYSQVLDDWPKDGDHPRSPKYLFGENDPIYVQVANLGTDPQEAEPFVNFVKVTSDSDGLIYLDLKETGVNTQIFRNSEAEGGELLYLSTINSDGNDKDKIKVINEEKLIFSMQIQPGYDNYVTCKTVMVDRAEIGTEFQEAYHVYCEHGPPFNEIKTGRFGGQFHDNIGGEPGLVWYKNFKNADLASKQEHWHADSDTPYADSVDIVSWSGHNTVVDSKIHFHFFNDSPNCDIFPRASTNLGDADADWVIFDTCYSLHGLKDVLKADLLTSGRCAHMFLGYGSTSYWEYENCGEYFTQRLKEETIQQAWFDYCDETLFLGSKVKAFRVSAYAAESLAGSGPIEVMRDPIATDDWKSKAHINTTGPPPP